MHSMKIKSAIKKVIKLIEMLDSERRFVGQQTQQRDGTAAAITLRSVHEHVALIPALVRALGADHPRGIGVRIEDHIGPTHASVPHA